MSNHWPKPQEFNGMSGTQPYHFILLPNLSLGDNILKIILRIKLSLERQVSWPVGKSNNKIIKTRRGLSA